ncbi:MAG: hypothetical protein CVT63_01695 [Candidatus Anoxymicrobium japonicum]|uniref:Uncharacterized protein n=1 Tax=Candidatus Anoxymicrobium japonicum TaxID=2013648 RepID=A0A2N3G7P9_9ACTN|nr:MAG: hypothetical protein CVT63_01695 [Candidatus Anoxymicrobium japonicum]
MTDRKESALGEKIRLYPVTRIQGRADIEILFTPQQVVAEARFRALETRGIERMVVGKPALRVPQILARTCGACGPFHQLASAMAIESACGVEVPEDATSHRETLCWLFLAATQIKTMIFQILPDFALPMSDAAVKNITGIYMVDQESVSRLSSVLVSIDKALEELSRNRFHPGAIVVGGVSGLPDQAAVDRALELLDGCADNLHESMRLAEMLTRRESKMVKSDVSLEGFYMTTTDAGRPAILGNEITCAPFAGGEESTMEFKEFLASIEERPVPWFYLKPLAVTGFEPCMVGSLARVNVGFGPDTPVAELECDRVLEQWGHPLDREHFLLAALALEAIWGWEKAKNLLAEGAADAREACAGARLSASNGFAVLDSPGGVLAHAVSLGSDGAVSSYKIMSPLQFNGILMNSYLSRVAGETVMGIEVSDAAASRLARAVRSFNPCVPCGTH